jgi:hypothetical protein
MAQFAAVGRGQLRPVQSTEQEVQLDLLCRPRRYADQGWGGVGGGRMRPALVGIIYRLLT